jgi:hypothetical protein
MEHGWKQVDAWGMRLKPIEDEEEKEDRGTRT